MPIFEMDCVRCNHSYEAITTTAAGALATRQCPRCGSQAIKKRFSAIAKPINALDPRNLTNEEIGLMLDHKRDLEKGVASGRLELGAARGPQEFRPEIGRRFW